MREIDVRHLGRPSVICCFAIDDVIVDPGPESSHAALLEALGDEVPARILLTHIHLDHAGATGALVRRWPGVEVWVHEKGAPHVVDPSKLVESASRLYLEDMERLWGEIVAVPETNLRVLRGDERIGPWHVLYTPGHASHHVSYLHTPSGTAFVGDVGGVRIDGAPVIPPTPPPDIDLEAWHASLHALAAWRPERLAITHFGAFEDAGEHLAAMHERLDRWGELARRTDADGYRDAIVAELRSAASAGVAEAMMQALPPDMQWAGLNRYWRKRNG